MHLQANASVHAGLVALPRSCTCRDENRVKMDEPIGAIFFYKSENEYRNSGNKYETRNCQK
jgi:hypothetical protein